MDRHRGDRFGDRPSDRFGDRPGDRFGDRPGDRFGDRPGDRFGDGGRHPRMQSRWSSGSPTHQPPRYPRGGGEGFSGGAGGGGRYHPYRAPQDYPPSGGGFRGGGPAGFGHPLPMAGGPKRGFSARGGSPDHADGNKFAKLFIGSVPRTATEEDIRPLFEEHGEVIEVALIKDRKTGQQQGCCFIKYATSEEADRAIRALHNQYTLPGGSGPIQVRYADGDRERHGAVERKLFVASLNKQAASEEIEEIFSQYGRVEDVYIMKDELKQSRGCGFVKFSTRDDAVAAMNALHGNYVMRGCDQPLIVRFADPKRPRPAEPRGGPTFGGPGFSPRSDAALIIRPTANLDEPRGGRMPPDAWHPLSPRSLGPSSHFNAHESGSQSAAKGGVMATSSDAPGTLGVTCGPTNGDLSSLSATPSSSLQQGFNPSMAQVRPVAGQQISALQKPLMPPQNFSSSLQLHQNQQTPASQSQSQNLQAPMQQLGLQVPQSGSLTSYGQNLPLQQLPGLAAQLSTSQPAVQQNASAGALQNPLSLQQQSMPAVANQQQFPASNITQQLLQQPIQQLPSQLPQMLLQQQAQALQSSFQSSQQAIFQLQQQLQLMHQSNLNQQQISQAGKQQSAWTGLASTSSTPASTPAAVMPSTRSATTPLPVSTTPAVPLTCNWTEHTSPEGFKYYYNSITRESKWEKPEEFSLFEQQQQQQKLLLSQQQQQQKLVQQLQSPSSHTQSHTQIQSSQQASQTQQVQPQMQMRQQAQLQLLHPSLAYQASGVAGHQNMQELNYSQLQAASAVIDPTRAQQGIQAAQEWAWKNKTTGS
ncbi:flowering time control protein FCA isoform X2 [Elaeis guineensis]|uniref:Flowering time control protein FCA n=1 Tax=Elaeis guineensis var. tenera TaxID=51953 RepID=A0A6I9RLM7_ELAGV|nr:flowering time control protein FCA [Elaeis guineensis]